MDHRAPTRLTSNEASDRQWPYRMRMKCEGGDLNPRVLADTGLAILRLARLRGYLRRAQM